MNTVQIIVYKTLSDKEPYRDWELDLGTLMRAKVRDRLARVRLGNFGDAKMLKNADVVWELRINYGPGYRIYFGKMGKTIVLLLTAGDKGSQKNDIEKAKRYWLDYKEQI